MTRRVQREAACALGRLREPRAIPALGAAAAIPRDPILTHALTYALIEIDAPTETRALLNHRAPLARRAALLALDASADRKLDAAPVFAALRDKEPALRSAALQIAVRHPEWGRAAADYLATVVVGSLDPAAQDVVARLLAVFLPAQEVRDWLRASPAPALDPVLLLDAIAGRRARGTRAGASCWRRRCVRPTRHARRRRCAPSPRTASATSLRRCRKSVVTRAGRLRFVWPHCSSPPVPTSRWMPPHSICCSGRS